MESLKRATGVLRQIPPGKIDRNPENPRLIFRPEEMESLLASIDTHGIQVPLAVFAKGERFRLIDGERRWRCALKLNLKMVPALVQDEPSELENLLLMYNIHSLREQWDYFTIASKLQRIIQLFAAKEGVNPSEEQLSRLTGLTRGQIRRCRLLIGLPDKYKSLLLKELELPKAHQRISEDFFIEMERSLKTIIRRFPAYDERSDEIRDALIQKFSNGAIEAVTDFRQLAKIATAVSNVGLSEKTAKRALDRVFDKNDGFGIREAYRATVEFEYDEKKAVRYVEGLIRFLEEAADDNRSRQLDADFIERLQKLLSRLRETLGVVR